MSFVNDESQTFPGGYFLKHHSSKSQNNSEKSERGREKMKTKNWLNKAMLKSVSIKVKAKMREKERKKKRAKKYIKKMREKEGSKTKIDRIRYPSGATGKSHKLCGCSFFCLSTPGKQCQFFVGQI